MSENVQLVRSDYATVDVITTSKKFIYTWKINNFQLLYEQNKSYIQTSSSLTVNGNLQLWDIKLLISESPNSRCNIEHLLALVSFSTEKAQVIYDDFKLKLYIVNKSKNELCRGNEFKSTNKIISSIPLYINKALLLNSADALLPDGNLTLKFELIFNKGELIYNDIISLSCMNRPKLIALENMFNNVKFSDAKISVDGKEFHVHKVILAARSPVFAAMFEHNMKESKENTIKITDFDHKIVQEMLRFVYTNQVKDIKVVASDLLVAADKYDVEQLKLLCEETLINDLNAENVTTLLIYAEKYGVERLKKFSLNFFKLHAKEIVKTKNFEEDFNATCI